MTAVTDDVRTALTAPAIAELAVSALLAEADLTPKPGLVDRRGSGAHTDMNLDMLHASAEALRPAFAQCAWAASELPVGAALRARLGRIGRAGERAMLAATDGVNTHRGAMWALGLLCAAAAAAAVDGEHHTLTEYAASVARIPDPDAGSVLSHGALVRRRHGVPGAPGQAQAGFPDVIHHALPALWTARDQGADEPSARLDALLALTAHVADTCVLHRGGTAGLGLLQDAAQAVLDHGGCHTAAGRTRFTELDQLCSTMHLSPGGSGDLLAAALFLDAVQRRG
jgi:triphosphoribosyl-dephospho-CoA synthase